MILGSFLLLFLLLCLHHVRVARQLLPWELALALPEKVFVLGEAETL